MRVLLDSNAYSLFISGNRQVSEILRNADEILISVIVLGELMAGFRQGTRLTQNMSELRSFLDSHYVSLIHVTSVTADYYSMIVASLRAKGRPIPSNDTWIAAQAMENQADLISADGHFEHVDGIVWERLVTS